MNTKNKKLIAGIIKRHADGFGFLIPDDVEHADVYIPKNHMTGIMTNDRVLTEVHSARGDNRFYGEIVKVMSRGTKKIVGRLHRINDYWYSIPDESKGWGQDLRIKADPQVRAKNGDLVHVEIVSFPGEGPSFTGRIVEVIGDAQDPLTDVRRVLRSHNIPEDFSTKTLSEVAILKEDPSPTDWKNRKDLTRTPLVTIDGATAKDFDDAVFAKQTNRGFHLIVAIADVSHYVKPGTSLDQDAYDRGTSVYFPHFVVPMLPEILSNGLCSLKPHVPRLCLVADMEFSFQGDLIHSEFYEAVMKSHARLTYGEAQELIDGQDLQPFRSVKPTVLACSDLAKILMARRFREGSLDLNISQTELEIDAAGNPVDVQKSERLFAHRLIEELMLAANVAVAQFLEKKGKGAIYRVHEDPSAEAIKLLDVYLHNLGSKVRISGDQLQKKLSKVLAHFAGHAEEQIISILTLRSLSQAKYSAQNIGHFGLGFQSYTHFTSPIRRYPDLIVHRLLKHYVVSSSGYTMPPPDDLTTAANMLSSTEQRAVKCERQFMSIKKARFMERHLGQEFKGMISSVARFGVFVLLREFDVDGLVKVENLGDDRWVFDEENLRLVGDRSKTFFKIGQLVTVSVTQVDVELGQITFDLHPDFKYSRFTRRTEKGETKTQGPEQSNDRDRASTQKPSLKPTAERSSAKAVRPSVFDETSKKTAKQAAKKARRKARQRQEKETRRTQANQDMRDRKIKTGKTEQKVIQKADQNTAPKTVLKASLRGSSQAPSIGKKSKLSEKTMERGSQDQSSKLLKKAPETPRESRSTRAKNRLAQMIQSKGKSKGVKAKEPSPPSPTTRSQTSKAGPLKNRSEKKSTLGASGKKVPRRLIEILSRFTKKKS